MFTSLYLRHASFCGIFISSNLKHQIKFVPQWNSRKELITPCRSTLECQIWILLLATRAAELPWGAGWSRGQRDPSVRSHGWIARLSSQYTLVTNRVGHSPRMQSLFREWVACGSVFGNSIRGIATLEADNSTRSTYSSSWGFSGTPKHV